MANGDFKNLPRRTASDKILHDKAFSFAKNPKCEGHQRELASMVYNLFDKKWSGGAIKSEIILNQQLAEEVHQPIVRKFQITLIF